LNLFVVGWNGLPDERTRALAAVCAMRDTYPLLDPETLGTWSGVRGFAAWVHTRRDAASPRRYVHATPLGLVLYGGVAVDASWRFEAHDAAVLSDRWPELTDGLEGQFAVVRIDDRDETLEALNDPFGIHPTFVHNRGTTWWISNSVRLLARAAGLTEVDLEGMAKCIGMSWPGGDRTLVEGASQMPAAQRWSWHGDAPPRRVTYWWDEAATLPRKRSFGVREGEALADAMSAPLKALAATFGPLQCPITGGRDSRMLTGLMMARGVPGDYFTSGEHDDPDVRVGSAIARRFGLPHRRTGGSAVDLARAWDEVGRRVVRKNDGMVTLMHARTELEAPRGIDRLPVHLYGGGGELARGKRLTGSLVLRPPSVRVAVDRVQSVFGHRCGFLLPDARQLVRDHIDVTCRRLIERGFPLVDLPDAFDLSEYGRRWGGAQARQVADRCDVFLPYFTRAFVEATFATPATERVTERIPFLLLGQLSGELRSMPTTSPWPPRSVAAYIARNVSLAPRGLVKRVIRRASLATRRPRDPRSRDRVWVLGQALPRWRERHLDRGGSRLWSIVDRDRIERLTSDRAPPGERLAHYVGLYQVMTAFDYEQDFCDWVGAGS
jgi:asparagine synthase (glutamine-hydrolysing)